MLIIFFLEPYNPDKIPILFIHGAGGNPAEWASIIDTLGRQRFSVLKLYIPTGTRFGGNRPSLAPLGLYLSRP